MVDTPDHRPVWYTACCIFFPFLLPQTQPYLVKHSLTAVPLLME